MQWYTLLVRIDPSRAKDVTAHLSNYPQNPYQGVTLYHSFHVFGEWDICLWFSADGNDNAMRFVQDHIANIPGVIRTCTLSATPIKTYTSNW